MLVRTNSTLYCPRPLAVVNKLLYALPSSLFSPKVSSNVCKAFVASCLAVSEEVLSTKFILILTIRQSTSILILLTLGSALIASSTPVNLLLSIAIKEAQRSP